MSTTIYPQSNFTATNDQPFIADWDSACRAAGVDKDDDEISIVEVDTEDAEQAIQDAGNPLPPFSKVSEGVRDDRYLAVYEAGQRYVRLLHVTRTGPQVEQESYTRV